MSTRPARDKGEAQTKKKKKTTGKKTSQGMKREQRGKASWYGARHHGRKTASGERFNRHELTAAHRELPFGTVVRVENLDNGKRVQVRINDRGPFGDKRRIIDLSEAAAARLGMLRRGVVPVRLTVIQWPSGRPKK